MFVRFDTIPECNRQTDGHRDISALAQPALVSYAIALVKKETNGITKTE